MKAANEGRRALPAYDLWGTPVSLAQARALQSSSPPGSDPLRGGGAVRIDDATIALGRTAFYRETFGNEVFLSDVLGLIDGPMGLLQYGKALALLRGRGTTNLRVEIGRDSTVGGRKFRRGELIDTGLDVPRGSIAPLGL
ncbi:MAG TPA: hypothetical protein VGL19_17175, partial [Polyangiaceae bacterium]